MSENNYGLPEVADLQSVFDKVSIHLIKQGRPSHMILEGGQKPGQPICLYRGPDSTACAVGCLISDEDYSPGLESRGVESLLQPRILTTDGDLIPALFPESMLSGPMAEMLKDLQTIHDHASLDGEGRFVMQHLMGHLNRVADRYQIDSHEMWALDEEDAT